MIYNPIQLYGSWDEGYALDIHVIKSEFLGNDEFGYPHFDNIHSEVGEAIFQLKYRNNSYLLDELVQAACDFIKNRWQINIYGIVPVPPSQERVNQPVFQVAEKIANILGVHYSSKFFKKNSSIQVKNMTIEEKQKLDVSNLITKCYHLKNPNSNILIIDDLYSSGFTLNLVSNLLKQDPNIGKIYVLTMTKTKGR